MRRDFISIHALLAESDIVGGAGNNAIRNFYPRSPCGERPYQHISSDFWGRYFYPRSPCGERLQEQFLVQFALLFLSTLSLRRATRGWTLNINGPIFLSTLSLRRATDTPLTSIPKPGISIHALLAESDHCDTLSALTPKHFYPRSPCGERPPPSPPQSKSSIFLSTLSLRRATQVSPDTSSTQCISIHALLAESDQTANGLANTPPKISIHALLAESDE